MLGIEGVLYAHVRDWYVEDGENQKYNLPEPQLNLSNLSHISICIKSISYQTSEFEQIFRWP